jgi:hypothetical protein
MFWEGGFSIRTQAEPGWATTFKKICFAVPMIFVGKWLILWDGLLARRARPPSFLWGCC